MNRAEKRRQRKLAGKVANPAAAIAPPVPQALGLALQHFTAGRLAEAEKIYRQILNDDAEQPIALHMLGVIALQVGENDIAIEFISKALAPHPGYMEAHNNLGTAFENMGRLEDAAASYRKALALKPDFAKGHFNLGNALSGLGRLDAAVASYQAALDLKPDYAEAHSNLGLALKDLGRLDNAVASCRKAVSCQPGLAEAHNNLGNVLRYSGALDDAIASYRQALDLRPDYLEAGRNLLYGLLVVPGLTPKHLFAEHLQFSEHQARAIARPAEAFPNDPAPERRLRIGYLSSDFRNHPVGNNLLPLISSHDRAQFELYCYADVARPDAMTDRFRACVDHWRPITATSDHEVARMVRADAIDVLVCLAGRFDGNRPLVCAHRAAPVQVSFHDGATSGLAEMDYWLTDDVLHPPDTPEMFTEDLHRLPVFYQFPPLEDAPPVTALAAEQAGFTTFGSFNHPAKINENVVRLWAEILTSVPGSRFMLKYKQCYAQASVRDAVVEKFVACGVAAERIILAAPSDSLAEHLERYGAIDIALDTFPFNGATTTFQALSMGVPVISLTGQTFISRAAGSMLHHIGLGELAVDTPEAYVACARDLAADLPRLRALRTGLRDRVLSSPLCDAPAYATSVEAAFRRMWRTWCAKPEPRR
jgi:predicted O-linked N-acetylglucosamine transferase (SPINDLY family)